MVSVADLADRAPRPLADGEQLSLGSRDVRWLGAPHLPRGLVIAESQLAPGTRRQVEFGPGVDLLVHHLGGLDLSRAERVEVGVRVEPTGGRAVRGSLRALRSPARRGADRLQRHFAQLPPDVVFDVRAYDGAGRVSLASFAVPHVFVG